MSTYEYNFDGLIGPSHNFSGLALGNKASQAHAMRSSKPKAAALQGIEKMRTLIKMGYPQGFIPPHARPHIATLRQLGFSGTDESVLQQVAKRKPEYLPLVYSASNMWAANAATVTPSIDSIDGKLHLTPANLITTPHRAIEGPQTERILRAIFNHDEHFTVHTPLPSHMLFSDEGAANHTRMGNSKEDKGVGLFVYGKNPEQQWVPFPARQAKTACEAIALSHSVNQAIYLEQSQHAIQAGAFHNDVVAVGNDQVLFHHQYAFDPQSQSSAFAELSQHLDFTPICVANADIPIEDAISSYLFNSQLITSKSGMTLIAPIECYETDSVRRYLEQLTSATGSLINQVRYVNVRESMQNGGGPACLRLRVQMTTAEVAAVNPSFLLNNDKLDQLSRWVERHYRDELSPADLLDPAFALENFAALDDLCSEFKLGTLYDFQTL